MRRNEENGATNRSLTNNLWIGIWNGCPCTPCFIPEHLAKNPEMRVHTSLMYTGVGSLEALCGDYIKS